MLNTKEKFVFKILLSSDVVKEEYFLETLADIVNRKLANVPEGYTPQVEFAVKEN